MDTLWIDFALIIAAWLLEICFYSILCSFLVLNWNAGTSGKIVSLISSFLVAFPWVLCLWIIGWGCHIPSTWPSCRREWRNSEEYPALLFVSSFLYLVSFPSSLTPLVLSINLLSLLLTQTLPPLSSLLYYVSLVPPLRYSFPKRAG